MQEELKSNTIKMVEQSRVLNTPGAEKQTKRELFDALRQELEWVISTISFLLEHARWEDLHCFVNSCYYANCPPNSFKFQKPIQMLMQMMDVSCFSS